MKSIKPGRGPSMMGGIMAIAAAVFGLLWTVGASSIATPTYGNIGPFSDLGFGSGIGSIFPLFGVVFIFIAVAIAIYNFKNATGKQRYSEYDIVDGDEEPDSLNERFGQKESANDEKEQDAAAFCPYCGTPAREDYRFCKNCGKQLSESK